MLGAKLEFVQDNDSLSLERGVVRGCIFRFPRSRSTNMCVIRGSRLLTVNNFYVQEGNLTYEVLEGGWTDAGTFESLLRANNLVAKTEGEQIDGHW